MIGISDELPWGGSQTATHPFAMGLNIILSPKCARMGLKEIRSRETGKNIHTGIYRGDISNENMRIEPTKSRDIMISRILRYHAVWWSSSQNMQNSPNISGWHGLVNCCFIDIYIYFIDDHIYIHTYVCISQNHGGFDSRFARSSLHLYFETLKFKHKSWCRAKHGRMDPENVLPKQRYFRAVFQNQTRTLLSQHPQCWRWTQCGCLLRACSW